MKTYSIISLTLFVFVSSCSLDDDPISDDYSIYLLENSSTTFQEAEEIGLNEVELGDEPWLDIEDIYLYDFSSHYISLKIDKEPLFEGMLDEGNMFNFLVKPFVIVADNQRIAFGSFISSYSSTLTGGPHIYDFENWFLPTDILRIHRDFASDIDVRNDGRIEDALIAGNVYHAGIEVELIDVEIMDNSDTATVRYSFDIKNNDVDDLLVADPDLMGSELFHYYTNGVHFRGNDQSYYYSQYKEVSPPDPYDCWQSEWFVKIESGDKISRTVVLKGYPKFTNDTYRCYLYFSGPTRINLAERVVQEGRYWLGEVESNSVTLNY